MADDLDALPEWPADALAVLATLDPAGEAAAVIRRLCRLLHHDERERAAIRATLELLQRHQKTVEAAVSAERERCARVCEQTDPGDVHRPDDDESIWVDEAEASLALAARRIREGVTHG